MPDSDSKPAKIEIGQRPREMLARPAGAISAEQAKRWPSRTSAAMILNDVKYTRFPTIQ